MPRYLLLYHGGSQPASPAEGEKVMAAWNSWMGSLGTALVDGGSPTGNNKSIDKNGGVSTAGDNPATGYSILEAGDSDAAVTLAKGCPHLKFGGSIEVAEIMPVT
jgi:hypothetical protein